jgi:hypothetical protein
MRPVWDPSDETTVNKDRFTYYTVTTLTLLHFRLNK